MKRHIRTIVLLLAIGLLGACSASQATPTPATSTVAPATATPEFSFVLTADQAKSLASLKRVDDHPVYVMQYYRDYAQGPASRLASLAAGPKTGSMPAEACSLFTVLLDEDHWLFGRNFDWRYSPLVLVFAHPSDGYASVSTVDMTYLGITDETARKLMDLPLEQRAALLSAPQFPLDGMNEYGLAVAMAIVPAGDMQEDPAKDRVGSLAIIREILDHARDVDEAVDLIRQYNVFMGALPLHYLISDANRKAVLVEFYQGEMRVIENDHPWHSATNFLLASVEDPTGQCWRYDRMNARLNQTQGLLDTNSAMKLLSEVAQGSTQWSVVYQMGRREVSLAVDQDYTNVYTFRMSDY